MLASGSRVDDLDKLTVPKQKQWEAVYILKTRAKLIGYEYTPYKSVMKSRLNAWREIQDLSA
jgi:hypothetical protein